MIRSLLFSILTLLFISALQPSIQRRGAVGIVTAFAFKHEVRAGRSINKGVTAVRELSSTATAGATATTDSDSIHVPVGKDGDGAYTAATKGCFDVIDKATPLVLQEVRKQPIDTGRPFHVADYGTADGGTSLGLLTKIVRAVRERTGTESDLEEQHEIVIHYEDQLMNEWKSVFNHALGYKQVTDAYGRDVSVPTDEGDVYVEASGVGFHSQCYPSSSIDLGVSFTAMHWLSTSPSSLKGTTEVMHAARCSTGPPAAEHLQAGNDWSSILGACSKELIKGGRFVCVNFCVSGEGYFLGQTDHGRKHVGFLFGVVEQVARGRAHRRKRTVGRFLSELLSDHHRIHGRNSEASTPQIDFGRRKNCAVSVPGTICERWQQQHVTARVREILPTDHEDVVSLDVQGSSRKRTKR